MIDLEHLHHGNRWQVDFSTNKGSMVRLNKGVQTNRSDFKRDLHFIFNPPINKGEQHGSKKRQRQVYLD